MRRLSNSPLFLGHSGDTRDLIHLRRQGIASLVDLAMSERPLSLPREMVYCRFPIVDGPGNERSVLRAAIDTTVALHRAGVLTLVFCSAGMSRSPAVAAAAISICTGRSAAACLEDIVPGGGIDVSGALWADVLSVLVQVRASDGPGLDDAWEYP